MMQQFDRPDLQINEDFQRLGAILNDLLFSEEPTGPPGLSQRLPRLGRVSSVQDGTNDSNGLQLSKRLLKRCAFWPFCLPTSSRPGPELRTGSRRVEPKEIEVTIRHALDEPHLQDGRSIIADPRSSAPGWSGLGVRTGFER